MSLDRQHSNRLTRRRFLSAGALASMGFSLAELFGRPPIAIWESTPSIPSPTTRAAQCPFSPTANQFEN